MPTELTIAAAFTEIIDRVIDVLAEASLPELATPRAFADRNQAMTDLTGVRLAVMPQGCRRRQITRGSIRREFDVNVAAIIKLERGEDSKEVTDRGLAMAEAFSLALENSPLDPLSDGSQPRQTATEINLPYAPEILEKDRVVLCPVSFTYWILN